MKKKGFTLVELLATIVVLSVIALIATPIILNVIEKAKKGALVSSVNGLVESANMYYTNEIIKGDITGDVIFDFEEGIQISSEKLSYKGKVYNGKLILTSDSDVITCIDDGKYYAYKEKDSDEVISGNGTCLYDGTTGDFTIESDTKLLECENDKTILEQRIKELEEQIKTLNDELNIIKGEKETLEETIKVLKDQIAVKEAERDEYKAKLEELNEKIASVTATSSDVLSGKTILTSSGLVTGSMANNGSVNETLSINGTYAIPKGYHDGTGKITQSITTKAAATYTPGTSNQTIASGQYLSGAQTIKGDSNLIAANIKKGTSIFGVEGTYTSDANAVVANILKGKTAYVNGSKITGTMTNKAGTTTAASTVTENSDNAEITIPANGYYSTSSKISVPIETLKNEISLLKNSYAIEQFSTLGTKSANNGGNGKSSASMTMELEEGIYIVLGGALTHENLSLKVTPGTATCTVSQNIILEGNRAGLAVFSVNSPGSVTVSCDSTKSNWVYTSVGLYKIG